MGEEKLTAEELEIQAVLEEDGINIDLDGDIIDTGVNNITSAGLDNEDEDEDDEEINEENLSPSQKKRRAKREARKIAEATRQAEVDAMRLTLQESQEEINRMREQLNATTQSAVTSQTQNALDGLRQAEVTLRQQLVQAGQTYDYNAQADILLKIQKVNSEIDKAEALQRNPQYQQQYQQQQQSYNNTNQQQRSQEPTQLQRLAASHIEAMLSKPEHSWINAEFGADRLPATDDARKADQIAKDLANQLGEKAMGSKHFWDLVEMNLKKAVPHKYVSKYGQKSSSNPGISGSSNATMQTIGSGTRAKITLSAEQKQIISDLEKRGSFSNKQAKLAFAKKLIEAQSE